MSFFLCWESESACLVIQWVGIQSFCPGTLVLLYCLVLVYCFVTHSLLVMNHPYIYIMRMNELLYVYSNLYSQPEPIIFCSRHWGTWFIYYYQWNYTELKQCTVVWIQNYTFTLTPTSRQHCYRVWVTLMQLFGRQKRGNSKQSDKPCNLGRTHAPWSWIS